MILIDPHNPNATKIHAQLSHLTDLTKFPLHTWSLEVTVGCSNAFVSMVTQFHFWCKCRNPRVPLNSNADLQRVAECMEQQSWMVHNFPS